MRFLSRWLSDHVIFHNVKLVASREFTITSHPLSHPRRVIILDVFLRRRVYTFFFCIGRKFS